MSNWADDLIAGPMGFTYAVLFPRAREAIKAWTEITNRPVKLPTNICLVARDWATYHTLHDIDETGLAPGITTQLYGYREVGNRDAELDLDPLMTGWFDRPCATSSIISFGQKKAIDIGGGGAFLTQDQGLAEEMERRGYFPSGLIDILKPHLALFTAAMRIRRERAGLWDRHLEDMLPRIRREQIIPWRVMRRANNRIEREAIIKDARACGIDVGINYPPLSGSVDNGFGATVLNFFVSDDYTEDRIRDACGVICGAIR